MLAIDILLFFFLPDLTVYACCEMSEMRLENKCKMALYIQHI